VRTHNFFVFAHYFPQVAPHPALALGLQPDLPALARGLGGGIRYLYRCLRRGEAPYALRKPRTAHIVALNDDQLRDLIVEGVSNGNNVTSPFLHTSTCEQVCHRILSERRDLYFGTVVRIDASMVLCAPSRFSYVFGCLRILPRAVCTCSV